MNRSAGKATSKLAKQQKQTKSTQKIQKKKLSTKKPTRARKLSPTKLSTRRFSAAVEATDAPVSSPAWAAPPDYPLSPKLTTSISGLPAIPNGRHVLDNLLTNTLHLSLNKIKADPTNYLWRSIANNAIFRLQTIRKFPEDDHMAERIIGAGQIEELIQQQEHELTLFDSIKPKKEFDPESFRGAAPAFGSEDPRCETQIFPLPEEVAMEIATGKVTVNPYHPSKPVSRKFIQHLGYGDKITPEMHAEYDKLMALTEEEVANQTENMKNLMGTTILPDAMANFIGSQYGKNAGEIDPKFFDSFDNSTYVYPELDKAFVTQWKEAHEIHTRKL